MLDPFPDDDETVEVDAEVLAQIREAARRSPPPDGSFDDDTIEDEAGLLEEVRDAAVRDGADATVPPRPAGRALTAVAESRDGEFLARNASAAGGRPSLPDRLEGSLPDGLEGSLPGSFEGSLPGSSGDT